MDKYQRKREIVEAVQIVDESQVDSGWRVTDRWGNIKEMTNFGFHSLYEPVGGENDNQKMMSAMMDRIFDLTNEINALMQSKGNENEKDSQNAVGDIMENKRTGEYWVVSQCDGNASQIVPYDTGEEVDKSQKMVNIMMDRIVDLTNELNALWRMKGIK
jgi:hypothetical protein